MRYIYSGQDARTTRAKSAVDKFRVELIMLCPDKDNIFILPSFLTKNIIRKYKVVKVIIRTK